MQFEDRADLAPAERAEIERITVTHRTLEDVVRWGLTHTPPRLVTDVVVQDEFTHDVVVQYRDELYLVYDTT